VDAAAAGGGVVVHREVLHRAVAEAGVRLVRPRLAEEVYGEAELCAFHFPLEVGDGDGERGEEAARLEGFCAEGIAGTGTEGARRAQGAGEAVKHRGFVLEKNQP